MLTGMDMSELEALAARLDGVRCGREDGRLTCRYHGRLVVRQLDATHAVIRCAFDVRGAWLDQFPETFSVPTRFVRHMMIVADLAGGDSGAIEDALIAAWQLQSVHEG
jgi:hypothetical protein